MVQDLALLAEFGILTRVSLSRRDGYYPLMLFGSLLNPLESSDDWLILRLSGGKMLNFRSLEEYLVVLLEALTLLFGSLLSLESLLLKCFEVFGLFSSLIGRLLLHG